MDQLEHLQDGLDKMRARLAQKVDWRQARHGAADAVLGSARLRRKRTDTDDRVTPWLRAGWGVIGVFLMGGTVWAASSNLDGAAVALGTVGVESHRKSVAHLDGGEIREILVREGDTVVPGQPLVRMDDTHASATLDLLQSRLHSFLARDARLRTEQTDQTSIDFPDELLNGADNPKVLDIMDGEMQVLETTRADLDREDRILFERMRKFHAEIRGLKARREAAIKRRALLAEEHEMMAGLVKDGLVARNRVLGLERGLAEADGDIQDLSSKIAQASDEISQLELERAHLTERHLASVARDLQQVQEQIAETRERIKAAENVLRRAVVAAPERGVVVGLRHHTQGGIVRAGEPILDIVPDRDAFVFDLRIDPNDIDVVYPGQTARIRLSAFNARTTPMMEGKVVHVSADRLTDPTTGVSYFAGRVAPDDDVADDAPSLQLTPGMHAEVFLVTGERTVLDFLLDPLIRASDRTALEY